MSRLTESDLKNMGLREVNGVWRKVSGASTGNNASKGPKSSKYRNKRCQDELGNNFDSQKELKRWGELQLLYRAGEITELRRQVSFELNEGGAFKYRYVADFTYKENGVYKVEDVKGKKTVTYLKKCKLMLKVHGIEIRET